MSTDNTQLALMDGESEDALLVPPTQAAKLYTGKIVAQNELKKRYICELIAWGYTIEDIARKAGCSTRIVKALGAKFAEDVARNATEFADVMDQKAARLLFLIEQKADSAKFGELGVTFGILKQRATETRLAAGSMAEPVEALEIAPADDALEKFRAGLKKLNHGDTGGAGQ